MELGLPISSEQIDELRKTSNIIDFDRISYHEKRTKHDVVANIHAWGELCPKARGIIHIGATSAFVTDHADLIMMKDALSIIEKKILNIINNLYNFSYKYKNLATLSYTHLQPAQPTTMGKRSTLWIYDLLLDLKQYNFVVSNLLAQGVKGTTGTQASFLELFNGNGALVDSLETLVAKKLGFDSSYCVTGQVYPRKIDSFILDFLSCFAQSAYKFSNDIRLLQSFGELCEPFDSEQVGSSAMPYKKNPMLSERISSLARLLMSNSANGFYTASLQWLERSLDDSAGRRIYIPSCFYLADGISELYLKISDGLTPCENVISKRIDNYLPFLIVENLMISAAKRGGDRQKLHEKLRQYALEAKEEVENGRQNNLLSVLAKDDDFKFFDLDKMLDGKKICGRAEDQTLSFLQNEVKPILDKRQDLLGLKSGVEV